MAEQVGDDNKVGAPRTSAVAGSRPTCAVMPSPSPALLAMD